MKKRNYHQVKKTLKENYQVDLVHDLVFGIANRVFFYGDVNEKKSMRLQLIAGDEQLLSKIQSDELTLESLEGQLDLNNRYAEVSGTKRYLEYVRSCLYGVEEEQDFSIPISDGNQRIWLRFVYSPVLKNPNLVYIQMMDITPLLIHEESIYEKSHKDPLTGLFNKYTLDFHYGLRYQEDELHALYLDLDGFKQINDIIGHREGDDFLLRFAKLLKEYETEYDRFYRIGGDEFIGLFFGKTKNVLQIAESIVIRTRQIDNPSQMEVSVSIGVCQATIREDLLRKADLLMYRAKALGKNQICFAKEDEVHL